MRKLLCAAALAVLANIASAAAQTYPAKSVTIIVPLAPGTGMDLLARLYGDQLAQTLGQHVGTPVGQPGGEVAEPLRSEQQVAHDEQGPALTDEIERVGR